MKPGAVRTIRLNPLDDVEVALADLEPGSEAGNAGISCLERVPAGHKLAVRAVKSGEPVRKGVNRWGSPTSCTE